MACVSHEAKDARFAHPEVDLLGLGEYRLTCDYVERTRAGAAMEDEKPCLPARIQMPGTVRLQLEALEYKVRI